MSLENKILKEFSKIREMQYRSYPEMRITDEETYKTIKGTSFIKILIKGLLSFFSLQTGKKKYFILGTRERDFISSLPKKETIIIVQSFREVLFAFQKGFNFIYMGLLQYQMIRAFIENDHKVIKHLTRKVTKIISHSIGSPLLIYFTDVHPAEILFRIVTEAKEKKFTTVCGQHGVFLNVNKPDFVYEGKYSDYFLATGNSQEKVAPNKIGNKVKVINLGPLFDIPNVKDNSDLEIVLVSNGGADVDKARSNLTAKIILDISKILEDNKINYVIKPHPSDDLRIFKENKHIYLGDKGSLISNKARIFMGFVSTLLYEAHVCGHTTAEIKLNKSNHLLNHEENNSFFIDHTFYENDLEAIGRVFSPMSSLKKKNVEDFYLKSLQSRLKSCLNKIDQDKQRETF